MVKVLYMYICPEILNPLRIDDSGGQTRKEADKTLVQTSPMYSSYIHVHVAYSVSTSFICIFTYPCIYSGMQYHAWWFNYPGGLPHVRLELHTSCVAYRL